MKTRNGFVSNSSSSSFIIEGDIEDIAIQMIDCMQRDMEEYNSQADNEYTKLKAKIKRICKREDVKNSEIGIMFPSCNYDTYMFKKDGKCYITTSNNYDWDLDWDYHGGGDDYAEQDRAYAEIIDELFYSTRNNKIMRKGSFPRHENDIDYSNPPRSNGICSKCRSDGYGDKSGRVSWWKEDKDGNRYCWYHWTKLTGVKKDEVIDLKVEVKDKAFPDSISQAEV